MDGWKLLADLDACAERSWRRSRVRNKREVGESRSTGGIGGVWGCIDRFACLIKEALPMKVEIKNGSCGIIWNLLKLSY